MGTVERNGICVAGNAIVDVLYPIERYPAKGELTTILEGISRAPGGALCNVGMDLAALDPSLDIYAVGAVGDDEEGNYLLDRMRQYLNIDLGYVKKRGKTSFTAVMSESTTKQRTFFQYRGANATLCERDFVFDKIPARLFHIGYILLLDELDKPHTEYGTNMAALMKKAREAGLKTSVDVVSEVGERFTTLVPPALKYTDYCIINELEAQQATGVPLRTGQGELLVENMDKALEELFHMGVSTWAVVHAPEGGFGMDAQSRYVQMESLHLPEGFVKGTVGAGDAFCAGVLMGAYRDMQLRDAIVLGTASAACSLSEKGATEGMRGIQQTMELYRQLGGEV